MILRVTVLVARLNLQHSAAAVAIDPHPQSHMLAQVQRLIERAADGGPAEAIGAGAGGGVLPTALPHSRAFGYRLESLRHALTGLPGLVRADDVVGSRRRAFFAQVGRQVLKIFEQPAGAGGASGHRRTHLHLKAQPGLAQLRICRHRQLGGSLGGAYRYLLQIHDAPEDRLALLHCQLVLNARLAQLSPHRLRHIARQPQVFVLPDDRDHLLDPRVVRQCPRVEVEADRRAKAEGLLADVLHLIRRRLIADRVPAEIERDQVVEIV